MRGKGVQQGIIFFITILVSVLFMVVAFSAISLEDTIDRITDANPVWLLVACLSTTLAIWCRSARWKILLQTEESQTKLFMYVSIGTLLNQLPLRAGDFTRASLIQSPKTPFVTALSTLLIENLFDIVTIVIVLTLTFVGVPSIPPEIAFSSQALGLAAFAFLMIMVYLIYRPVLGNRLMEWLENLHRIFAWLGIKARYDELMRGAAALRTGSALSVVMLWTGLLWVANVSAFYAVTQAYAITGVNLIHWSAMGVMLISLSIVIPISFAGIGPYQVAVVVAGTALGVNSLDSITIGIVIHALSLGMFLFWGLISIPLLKQKFGSLFKSTENQTILASGNMKESNL